MVPLVRNGSQVDNPFSVVPKFCKPSRGIGLGEDECSLFLEDQPATLINCPQFNLKRVYFEYSTGKNAQDLCKRVI